MVADLDEHLPTVDPTGPRHGRQIAGKKLLTALFTYIYIRSVDLVATVGVATTDGSQ